MQKNTFRGIVPQLDKFLVFANVAKFGPRGFRQHYLVAPRLFTGDNLSYAIIGLVHAAADDYSNLGMLLQERT